MDTIDTITLLSNVVWYLLHKKPS